MKIAVLNELIYQFKTKVNMKTKTSILAVTKAFFILLVMCCLFSSCADVQPQVVECVTGHQYGFWGGLWHGIISPISFIGSLFSDDIDMWAINNNGGWYTFGFVLGAGILFGGSSKASSKQHITVWRLAFIADFGTRNFNLKKKLIWNTKL